MTNDTGNGHQLTFDLELFKKYDRPGPRYTSYPTAPHFHEGFDAGAFLAELPADAASGRDLSLYFHIPFCSKLCYFCGCTMQVTKDRDKIANYVDYLLRDVAFVAERTRGRTVRQIHWGGGTPTYLTPDEIRRIGEATRSLYDVADGAEIGIEVHPTATIDDQLRAAREVGFNRISMGVQDFFEPTQKAVNRLQPEDVTRRYVGFSRDLGFQSVNLDFIYGLPYQTRDTFEATLAKLIDIGPDRIAMFNYAHVPWMKKHQNVIDADTLPSPEEKLKIFKLAIETLTRSGYVFIGMDHFARPDDELTLALKNKSMHRNFQGYSTHANCDIIAHGMSGISQTRRTYAQNVKTLDEYYRAVDDGRLPIERGYALDDDDVLRRHVITRLMCDFSLDFASVEQAFDIQFDTYFEPELAELPRFTADDLITIDDAGVKVQPAGVFVIRNIAMVFDRHLREGDTARYSRTV